MRGAPDRIRTGVLAVKGRCPRPLDDGSLYLVENTGIEPVVPKAPDLQSSASPLMLLLQNLAVSTGIEPIPSP